MIWQPNYSDLVTQRNGGTGDMGSLAAGTNSDTAYEGRFHIPDGPFCLYWLRVHFRGSGTGTVDMTVDVDSGGGVHHDIRLFTVPERGIVSAAGDADVFLRVPLDELLCWVLEPPDQIVLQWDNPDTGNIQWGATCCLAKVPETFVHGTP